MLVNDRTNFLSALMDQLAGKTKYNGDQIERLKEAKLEADRIGYDA